MGFLLGAITGGMNIMQQRSQANAQQKIVDDTNRQNAQMADNARRYQNQLEADRMQKEWLAEQKTMEKTRAAKAAVGPTMATTLPASPLGDTTDPYKARSTLIG